MVKIPDKRHDANCDDFSSFSCASSQLVTMLFSRYLIAENIRKLPQIMP
jgi:hypothetical protein